MKFKRGDVYFADLSSVVGSEQGGVRPVVIVQNNIANKYSPTVVIAAITAQIDKPKLPTHVALSKDKYDLERGSVILVEQIRTVDKTRLTDKIFELEEDDMQRVTDAWNIVGGSAFYGHNLEAYYQFIENNVFDQVEDIHYEFKAIEGANPTNSVKNHIAEYTSAFLNSQGGHIFFGITDKERIIKGFSATSQKQDEIKRNIFSKIRKITPGISGEQISIIFHQVFNRELQKIENQYVLEIIIPASPVESQIHYLNLNGRQELYVRWDGENKKLDPKEIVSFTINKFKLR